jgi:hypothetical protein
MNEQSKSKKVIFAPGCFDEFEGTQEELDALVKDITDMVESGEMFDQTKIVDYEEMISALTDEEVEEMLQDIEENEGSLTRKLQ